jgi:hypothetical protein
MDVGILEPGDEEPALKIDDSRARRDPRGDFAVVADRHDSAGLDGDRLRPGLRRIDGVNVAATNDEIGV